MQKRSDPQITGIEWPYRKEEDRRGTLGDNSRRSGSFRPVARVTRISAMNLAGGPDETNAEPVHVVPIQCGSLTRLLITIVATDNEPNREKKWSALAGNINLWLSETMRREYNWT